MTDRIHAMISVVSETDDMPRVFEGLQIPWDESVRIGERGRGGLPSRWSSCSISSQVSETCPLDEHWKALSKRVQPLRDVLKGLSSRYSVVFEVIMFADSSRPPLHLEPDIVRAISEIGACVSVEIHCSYEPQENLEPETALKDTIGPSFNQDG